MTEEQLIKILHRVSNDNRYVILLNGNTVSIVRNHGECIDILLDSSGYELEITMKQNINNI